MTPFITDLLIRFVRVVVAAVLVALATTLTNVDLSLGLTGVLAVLGQAALTAAIHAAMEFLRTYFGVQPTTADKPRAGALRVRGKTALDYLPI